MNPPKPKAKDPFFGLKYLAYMRTGLTVNSDDLDEEAFVTFAKWQICKIRNVLWNDPIWDNYTTEEILVEFFAIRYDDNVELRKEFERNVITAKRSDLDAIEEMEARFLRQTKGIIENEKSEPKPVIPEDFEETF